MATKNYLSETGLATLWSQINKKCSKYLTEIPVATSTTIGGIKSGEGLSLSTDGTLSVVKETKTSLELSINPNSWVGTAAPYTVSFSTSSSFDPINHTIIVSHPTYSNTAADLAAYNAAARARIAIKTCSGNTIELVAFGVKPTVSIKVLITEV